MSLGERKHVLVHFVSCFSLFLLSALVYTVRLADDRYWIGLDAFISLQMIQLKESEIDESLLDCCKIKEGKNDRCRKEISKTKHRVASATGLL